MTLSKNITENFENCPENILSTIKQRNKNIKENTDGLLVIADQHIIPIMRRVKSRKRINRNVNENI